MPFPSFIELEAKDKVRYVAFTANEIAALRLAMPELTPSRIPAGTYPSLLRSYQTLGLFNFAVAHAQLPDDLVYHVVRAVFENQEEMMEAMPPRRRPFPATSSAIPSCRCIPARSATTGRSDAPDKRTRRVPSAESRFVWVVTVKRAVLDSVDPRFRHPEKALRSDSPVC